jgi:D-inositol-3-phosphate glycosyltransferase
MSKEGTLAVITAHSCPYSEIGSAENGGMSVYVREMTAALARRDVPSVIFTRKEDPGAPPVVDFEDGTRLVHVVAGPEGPLGKDAIFYHLPDFYRGVAAWARRENIEFRLINSHYWLSGWAGRRLSQLWGVPWIHMAHTLARVKDRDRPAGAAPEADQRVAVELEIVRSANRLIAPTNQEVEDLAFLYGADRGCVSVIPPGVDTTVFAPVAGPELRQRLGVDAQEKVVLFTGRLERLKGVEILVRALAAILDGRTERDVRLIVLGADSSNGVLEAGFHGAERARLAALAVEVGVDDRVDFLGTVNHEDLPAFYSLADVCAVPSYSESFGLVAVEAAACGTPVVASRIGGLRQLVLDGITGYTIVGHEPLAWADAIRRVIDDPNARAVMGSAARRLAQSYSWESSADALLTAYRETEDNYHRAALSLIG